MKSVLRFVFAFAMLGTGLLALIVVQLPPNAVTSAQTEPIVIPSLPPSESVTQSESIMLQDDFTTWEFRIVYFATADAITDATDRASWIAPARLLAGMKQPLIVHTVHTMDALRELESAAPLEAIILHPSAYDMIDREWLKPLLQRGVVLVTLNIPMVDVAELRNDLCSLARIDQINLSDETSGMDFFYIRDSHIFVENVSDLQPLEAYLRQTCGEESSDMLPQLAARAYWGGGGSQGTLASDFDIQQFQGLFTSHLLTLRSAQRNFAERDLPPTPAPIQFSNR